MLRVKWVCAQKSMMSCGMVRGVVPSSQLNFTRQISVDVKADTEVNMSDFPGSDIMVFQRVFGEVPQDMCRRARTQHKMKAVFDIDDALWMLPDKPKGDDFDKYQIFFPDAARKEITTMMVNEVDHVVCSTPELAEALKELGVLEITILENRVDPQFFALPRTKKDKKTIDVVWYAACGHNANAILFDPVFTVLFEEFPNLRLHLIGAAQSFGCLQTLNRFGNKVVFHNWLSYLELGRVLKEFDIAVCPVFDYPFTRCKSELKAIETAMSGLIPVMSDMPQYRRFASRVLTAEQASLLVVPNEKEAWVATLRTIITNHTTAIDTKELQRKTIMEYGVHKAIQEWGGFYHRLVL